MARGSGSSGRRARDGYRFVILGAGLTGLAAAARLEELGESDYLLVEKEDRPGGWATTDWTGEYGADKGVHVLYFRDDGVRRHVEELLAGRWIRHQKSCVVDSGGIRTPFPFHANLHGRPSELVEECLAGLRMASADQRIPTSPATFLEWILHSYGPGVARHFMVPYNSKMWTVPPDQMTADWMGGFIPPVDIARSLEGAALGPRQPGRSERAVLLSGEGISTSLRRCPRGCRVRSATTPRPPGSRRTRS